MSRKPQRPDHDLPPTLFDERHQRGLPECYARLLRAASGLDVALKRIHLPSLLALDRGAFVGLESVRLLLAEVSAARLDAEVNALLLEPDGRDMVRALGEMFADRGIEVRAAPLGGWSPDFSIFRDSGDPHAVLLGPHCFERPFPYRGPAFTSLHDGQAASLASRRFAELWAGSHDITAAVSRILTRPGRVQPIAAQRFRRGARIAGRA